MDAAAQQRIAQEEGEEASAYHPLLRIALEAVQPVLSVFETAAPASCRPRSKFCEERAPEAWDIDWRCRSRGICVAAASSDLPDDWEPVLLGDEEVEAYSGGGVAPGPASRAEGYSALAHVAAVPVELPGEDAGLAVEQLSAMESSTSRRQDLSPCRRSPSCKKSGGLSPLGLSPLSLSPETGIDSEMPTCSSLSRGFGASPSTPDLREAPDASPPSARRVQQELFASEDDLEDEEEAADRDVDGAYLRVIGQEDVRIFEGGEEEDGELNDVQQTLRRHSVAWPSLPKIDMEEHLCRAPDVFVFNFLDRRDRAARKVAEDELLTPRGDVLSHIHEEPQGLPKWRVASLEQRRAMREDRRRWLQQACPSDPDAHAGF